MVLHKPQSIFWLPTPYSLLHKSFVVYSNEKRCIINCSTIQFAESFTSAAVEFYHYTISKKKQGFAQIFLL